MPGSTADSGVAQAITLATLTAVNTNLYVSEVQCMVFSFVL
ncbi:MAG: hypothetical protein OXJ64_00315 [Boseongicola sp.]|nr:hypothetical protein [Boseongicola sp.]